MGALGFRAVYHGLKDLSEAHCLLCKAEVEDNIHFFFNHNSLMNEWDTFWAKLYEKIERVCKSNSKTFSNLDQVTKLLIRELWKQVGGIQQFQCTKFLGFMPG